MAGELTPLEHEAQIDALVEESRARPVVIFKFSRTCGTSSYAADQLHEYLQGTPADARYAVVTVQTHRAVSNEVAARLGVRHETPQLIVLRDGQVAWHGSHFRATAEALAGALA
jgi:bacillithiol system protein YtxJ